MQAQLENTPLDKNLGRPGDTAAVYVLPPHMEASPNSLANRAHVDGRGVRAPGKLVPCLPACQARWRVQAVHGFVRPVAAVEARVRLEPLNPGV